jgi:hypothetical protein
MARVACTLRGKRLDGGVSVLTYARVKCYICRVIGDPQLGINRFGSPLLLRHEDLVTALQSKSWMES